MRDNFTKGVKAVLAHRAGYRCSKPDCRAPTAGPSDESAMKVTNVGVAAHIFAASRDRGPRSNPALTPQERSSVSNGIWLCQIHAKQVDDDEAAFTADVLLGWKEHAENEARAMLGRPILQAAVEAAMELTLQRDANNLLLVVGSTNLPSGLKLWTHLHLNDGGHSTGKATVFDRFLMSEPHSIKGEPHPQAWYRVEVLAYFNGPWQQPEAVVQIVGRHGAHLVGPLAQPIDPDLWDSHTALNATFDCLAPPMREAPPLSDTEVQAAMRLTLEHFFTFDQRSARNLGDTVAGFMTYPGLREHDGWSSAEIAPGLVEVRFSYWNGDHPDVAVWHCVPASREVRFRNRAAKNFSWWPPY